MDLVINHVFWLFSGEVLSPEGSIYIFKEKKLHGQNQKSKI